MKHSITDGQIHQIFNYANTVGVEAITELLRRDFPDAFMQKGKWYVNQKGTVICYSGNFETPDSFGFFDNEWRVDLYATKNTFWRRLNVPAIAGLLVNHAQSLGFMKASGYILFDDEKNTLQYENSDFLIFNNGVWAEKVKPVVKEVNKWYKHANGLLRFFSTRFESVGLTLRGEWSESKSYSLDDKGDWVEASPLDVQFALMAYAYKEYKPGNYIESAQHKGSFGYVRTIVPIAGDLITNNITLYSDKYKSWASALD